MDQKTRKLMIKSLHPKDDTDKLYMTKKGDEDSSALRIALMHQRKNSTTTLKRVSDINYRI